MNLVHEPIAMGDTHSAVLVLSLSLLGCAGPPTPATPPEQDATATRIDSFMLRTTEAGFNGSLLVLRDGRAIIDKGYGLRDREAQLPNTPATVHAIGSITKQFTAACILKLQEDGRLGVHDSLGKYFSDVPADKRGITLHELLTHSAGFPGAIGDDNDPIDGAAFAKLAMTTPLEFKPGTSYAYSNVGYSLLGLIVEKVSGMGYERYLHDSLLVPSGVLRTGYRIPDWTREELAIGYRKDSTRWGTMLDHPTVDGGPGWHLRANGGILSTTHDMATWVEALRANKVLTKSSVDAMWSPYVKEGVDADSYYGYGWAIFTTKRGTRLITHNGGNGIQFADVLYYADEDVIVVLMSNAAPRGMQDLAWEVGRMVFDPAYEPNMPGRGTPLAGVPDGPMGDRMKALSASIAGNSDDAELEAWFRENLGPGFLADFPMEQHLRVFKQIRADIGAHAIDGVEQLNPEEFVLRLKSAKDGAIYRVRVQLRPSDARISGLGVEKE